jgi:hypothetical protein
MIALIRAGTADPAGLVDDTLHLIPRIDQSLRLLRRRLIAEVPSLYLQTTSPTVLAGASTIPVPTAFEGVSILEKLEGATYIEVPLYIEGDYRLGYREEGTNLVLSPPELAPGTYRLKYHQGITGDYSANIPVPAGFEDYVSEDVSAWVATRIPGDDPTPHLAARDRVWKEQIAPLRKRYGRTVKPGFRQVTRPRSW